jgi:hypothetical protein
MIPVSTKPQFLLYTLRETQKGGERLPSSTPTIVSLAQGQICAKVLTSGALFNELFLRGCGKTHSDRVKKPAGGEARQILNRLGGQRSEHR